MGAQRWLHRVTDTSDAVAPNICYLTADARSVLDFMRRRRREDSVATGDRSMASPPGCIGWPGRWPVIPTRSARISKTSSQISTPNWADLDAGSALNPTCGSPPTRPAPSPTRWNRSSPTSRNTARCSTASPPHCSTTRATPTWPTATGNGNCSTTTKPCSSSQSASYHAFTRMIQDPDQRARLSADIDTVTRSLPDMEPGLRAVMTDFFPLITEQMAEVGRTRQRCARRIRRFVAAGTGTEPRYRPATQRCPGHRERAAHTRSPTGAWATRYRWPPRPHLHRPGRIRDPRPGTTTARTAGDTGGDLSSFASLAGQVDTVELTDLVNRAVADGPVALPDVLGRLDEAYLAHVIVLWSLALKQPGTAPTTTEIVRFQSRKVTTGSSRSPP